MNVEKHLILLKGKDRTESISYCKYEKGKWWVRLQPRSSMSSRDTGRNSICTGECLL